MLNTGALLILDTISLSLGEVTHQPAHVRARPNVRPSTDRPVLVLTGGPQDQELEPPVMQLRNCPFVKWPPTGTRIERDGDIDVTGEIGTLKSASSSRVQPKTFYLIVALGLRVGKSKFAGSSVYSGPSDDGTKYMFIFAYPLIAHFLVIQFSYGGSRKDAVRHLSMFSR